MISWEDINELRSQIETDSRPLPAAAPLPRHFTVKIVQRHRKLNESNAASRDWHKRKSLEFQAAGLNWRPTEHKWSRREACERKAVREEHRSGSLADGRYNRARLDLLSRLDAFAPP